MYMCHINSLATHKDMKDTVSDVTSPETYWYPAIQQWAFSVVWQAGQADKTQETLMGLTAAHY